MANEHLKTALSQAGLTLEEFADIISVDPKTVQRWVAGRTPYARHRATISRALDRPEHELWPDDVPAPPPPGTLSPAPSHTGEVIGTWSHSNDVGALDPVAILTEQPPQEVDVLDPAGLLLLMTGFIPALLAVALDGTRVRVLTDDSVDWPDTTVAVDQITRRSALGSPSEFVLLRADDTMLLFLPVGDLQTPPELALTRQTGGVFDRLAELVDDLWERAATPASPPPAPASPVADVPQALPPDTVELPRRWPGRRPT